MKCSNCGKQFDYEKYYGICPKCGVYNRIESTEEPMNEQDAPFEQESPFEQEAGTEEQNVFDDEPRAGNPFDQPEGTQSYMDSDMDADTNSNENSNVNWNTSYYQPTKHSTVRVRKMRNSTMILLILVCVVWVAGITLAIVESSVLDNVRAVNRHKAENTQFEELVPQQAAIGEQFYLDSNQTIPMKVESVDILAQPNEVEGFPKDHYLIGVRLVCDLRSSDADSYELWRNIEMWEYVQFDQTFRPNLTAYALEGKYGHVLSGRKEFSGYGSYNDGYVYYFMPADSKDCAIFLQCGEKDTLGVDQSVRIPFQLNQEENGGEADAAE